MVILALSRLGHKRSDELYTPSTLAILCLQISESPTIAVRQRPSASSCDFIPNHFNNTKPLYQQSSSSAVVRSAQSQLSHVGVSRYYFHQPQTICDQTPRDLRASRRVSSGSPATEYQCWRRRRDKEGLQISGRLLCTDLAQRKEDMYRRVQK